MEISNKGINNKNNKKATSSNRVLNTCQVLFKVLYIQFSFKPHSSPMKYELLLALSPIHPFNTRRS